MEEQAIDRVYRIGFSHAELKVYRFLAEGTIEMNIEKVKKKKEEIAKTATNQKSKKGEIRTPMEGLIGSLFDDRPFSSGSKGKTQKTQTQASQSQAVGTPAMKRSTQGSSPAMKRSRKS